MRKTDNFGTVTKIEIYTSESETAELSAGFSSSDGRLSENVRRLDFLGGGGMTESFVTACEPSVTLYGRRIYGDKAQDYLFSGSRIFGCGSCRIAKLQLTYKSGRTETVKAVVSAYRSEGENGKPERISVTIAMRPEAPGHQEP